MDRWNGRWVVFDVGETLVDETRVWSTWADVAGVTRLTLMAMLGATIARGKGHQSVFEELGLPQWEHHRDELEASYGAIVDSDLYPDVRPTMTTLAAAGYRLAIFGNQPARRTADLQALELPVETIAMSDEMALAKPDPAYYARVLELIGASSATVAHVGDRVDNDVLPAAAAGLRSIWIRRGPWGKIQQLPEGFTPALVIDSLVELPDGLDAAFGSLPSPVTSV